MLFLNFTFGSQKIYFILSHLIFSPKFLFSSKFFSDIYFSLKLIKTYMNGKNQNKRKYRKEGKKCGTFDSEKTETFSHFLAFTSIS